MAKSTKRHRLIKVLILPAMLIAGVMGGGGYIFYDAISRPARALQTRQRTLLSTTNFLELEQTMRDVWRDFPLNAGDNHRGIDTDDPKLPDAIKRLDPHWVDVWASGISIELGGQWCHYGFETVRPDAKLDDDRLMRKDDYPSREISPGFWYYSETGPLKP